MITKKVCLSVMESLGFTVMHVHSNCCILDRNRSAVLGTRAMHRSDAGVLHKVRARCTAVTRVFFCTTRTWILCKYASAGICHRFRQVILSGITESWKAVRRWRKKSFLKRYGAYARSNCHGTATGKCADVHAARPDAHGALRRGNRGHGVLFLCFGDVRPGCAAVPPRSRPRERKAYALCKVHAKPNHATLDSS